MVFYGFQKLTLLDFPGKMACLLFTGGCPFRCPFCHNAGLVTDMVDAVTYDESEILSFLQKRKGLLEGVCITGGEPLMHAGLADFIRKVRSLGYAVKLDTNGAYPDRLAALIEEGLLDYVAMDIKNTPEKYAVTIGLSSCDLAAVEKSIALLKEGTVEYEFRTTVVQEFHTVEDIDEIARLIAGVPRYFLQNFVDSGHLIGGDLHAVSSETLQEMQQKAKAFVPNTALRGV